MRYRPTVHRYQWRIQYFVSYFRKCDKVVRDIQLQRLIFHYSYEIPISSLHITHQSSALMIL